MKEKDLRSKAYAVPVAVVAGLGMAGMGLVSDGIAVADTVTDTVNVTVQTNCTFNSVTGETYAGSATNGTEVSNFNDSGVHEFNLFCNDNNGYTVTATPYDLEATGIEDVISYTDNYTHTGVNSMWTAVIESDATGVTVTTPVPVGGGTIISSDSSTATAGLTFTATYNAYVGTATPAGVYTGIIEYTLSASGTSNNGGSNSGSGGSEQDNGGGDNGNSGDNGGSEPGGDVTDNTGNGDSGDTGSGNSGSGTDNTNPDNANSGDSGKSGNSGDSNSPQNASPTILNNTYNTYNTTNNTYTTNNNGGGSTTPAVANTQNTTDGNGSNTSNTGNNTSDNDYEKPLGVKTATTTSGGNSGIDPMPIIATGAVIAAVGVAAVVAAQKNKEEKK